MTHSLYMDVAEKLLALRRRLDRITARFDREIDEISHVAAGLDDIAAAHKGTRSLSVASRRPAAEERALREEARMGAVSVTMDWNADGSAEVRINSGAPFRLQAKPAALLRIIGSPDGRTTNDGLIGWRSYAEVGVALGKHAGRMVTPRNLTQTIYKLRKAFRNSGQNWFLIETDHRGHVRFALRSDAANASPERTRHGAPW